MAYTECSSEIPLTTFHSMGLYEDNIKYVFMLNGVRRGSEFVSITAFPLQERWQERTSILLYKYFGWFKKQKVKAVPLQAWSGPEGSRKLRFPDFMTTAQDGGKVVSLSHRPPLPPRNTPGTHLC